MPVACSSNRLQLKSASTILRGILTLIAAEPFNIKADALPVAQEMMILQGLLMGETTHHAFPRAYLALGPLLLNLLNADAYRWKMAKDKTQIIAQKLLQCPITG